MKSLAVHLLTLLLVLPGTANRVWVSWVSSCCSGDACCCAAASEGSCCAVGNAHDGERTLASGCDCDRHAGGLQIAPTSPMLPAPVPVAGAALPPSGPCAPCIESAPEGLWPAPEPPPPRRS